MLHSNAPLHFTTWNNKNEKHKSFNALEHKTVKHQDAWNLNYKDSNNKKLELQGTEN